MEYIATTGFKPLVAIPPANVTACCSAIATSKKRSGNIVENSTIPDPSDIAGVIPTNLSSLPAVLQSQSPKTLL